MKIEVSVAEIVDKVTILEIKSKRITDEAKLVSVKKEYEYLLGIMENELNISKDSDEYARLYEVNDILWNTENIKRHKESLAQFDGDFIQAARNTYIFNDQRAAIKKEINIKHNSNFVEEKEHKMV